MFSIDPVQFWHWLAFGGVLGLLEIIAPGFALIWLGLAAVLVGLMLLVWPTLGLPFQILAFAVLSVLSVVVWYRWMKSDELVSDKPGLNRRAEQHIGRRAFVTEAIINGRGRVKLGDSTWSVTGPDLPVGQMVEIVGAEGAVLDVIAVDSADSAGQPNV